eukprot:COSAG05_NODE_5485_length_1161_cov_1.644068_1_plen_331_part_01
MSFRDEEDRRLTEELAQMGQSDASKPVIAPADSPRHPLTEAEVEFFKREGYCTLRGFLDAATVARWRRAFEAHIGATVPGFSLGDDSTWPGTAEEFVQAQHGWSFPVMSHAKLAAAVVQLGGSKLIENRHTSNNATRWPSIGEQPDLASWQGPAAGHIDGYGPGGWSGGFMLGVTTLLSDVEKKGGAFTIWPRSHRAVHRFFQAHPEQIDGSFVQRADWGTWATLYQHPRSHDVGVPAEGVQVVGKAGDVCLWHSFLCHDGSPNLLRNQPRIAVISRFHHSQMFLGPQMLPPGMDGRVEPPNFEPLNSPKRTEERRYTLGVGDDLWTEWSE